MEPRDFKAELAALLEAVRKEHGLTLEELNIWITDAAFVWFGEQEDEPVVEISFEGTPLGEPSES